MPRRAPAKYRFLKNERALPRRQKPRPNDPPSAGLACTSKYHSKIRLGRSLASFEYSLRSSLAMRENGNHSFSNEATCTLSIADRVRNVCREKCVASPRKNACLTIVSRRSPKGRGRVATDGVRRKRLGKESAAPMPGWPRGAPSPSPRITSKNGWRPGSSFEKASAAWRFKVSYSGEAK